MPRRPRVRICPEIKDPKKRIFLDAVPMVRRIQSDVVNGQTLTGEQIEIPYEDRTITVYLHRAPSLRKSESASGSNSAACSESDFGLVSGSNSGSVPGGASGGGRRPVVFEYHGGGFVFGSAAADDGFCEKLCRTADVHVVGVDYSLAPERQYPVQIEEAMAVIAWLRKHADAYGIDAGKIAVTGFSAGGNLAAAVALRAAAEGETWLKAQILHYPFLDFALELETEAEYAADVDPVMVKGFVEFYCKEEERALPLTSPVCADPALLAKTAPALIIPAGQDRLCGQALQYAELLRKAGARAVCHVMQDVHHCYVEDACNPELYDMTTLPDKKKLHSPVFREKAEEAVRRSAEFLTEQFFSIDRQGNDRSADEPDPGSVERGNTKEQRNTDESQQERSRAMGNVLDPIYEKAKQNPQRVVFPEGTNEKMMQAAFECARDGYIKAILIGNAAELKALAEERGYDTSVFTFVDVEDEAYMDKIVAGYLAQDNVFLSEKGLRRRAKKSLLYYAMIMQRAGEAEVTFAGIDYTTRDVLLAGQEVIGLKPGISTISSIGLCDIPGFEGSEGQLLAIGDSAVCTNPDPEQLADIAISACGTVQDLLGWEPRCAMVCYSTLGSGDGPLIDKVKEALAIAQQKRPDLAIDGEFQFDAAVSPAVAAKKVNRESKVAGKANVVIWPDLNVGNIGVKLIQQFGKADAYGPMLQGFNKIVCDCSRGAPVSELKGNIIMSAVRAAAGK